MTDPRADQWDVAKLKAALLDDHSELSAEEILAVRQFIEQIGGLENAQSAIELLEELEIEGEGDDLDGLDDFDDLDELEDAA
jgi:hypothetical protein